MCGGSAVPRSADRGLPRRVRRADRAGLGDDRDQPGVRDRPSAEGHGRRRTSSTWRGPRRPDHARASSCGSPTTAATRFRGTASHSARSRSAARGSPRRTTTSTIPTSSTTAGCAPATSPRCLPNGYVMISDRAKDVIKSGGEWVSSVDLENTMMGHPDVLEAAVIGVPDERWDERPLACVVRKPGSDVTSAELRTWLRGAHRQVLAARALGVHRRGAEDQRRQVRQEGAAGPPRRRRARRRDAGLNGRRSNAR